MHNVRVSENGEAKRQYKQIGGETMSHEFTVVIPELHEFHYDVIADDESEAIEIAMEEYFKDPRLIKDCQCDDEALEEPIVLSDL